MTEKGRSAEAPPAEGMGLGVSYYVVNFGTVLIPTGGCVFMPGGGGGMETVPASSFVSRWFSCDPCP